MTRVRRVAVTSPQTGAALARRRGAVSPPPLTDAERRLAMATRRRQLRRAVVTLVAAAVLLVGCPTVLAVLPVRERLLDVPMVWLAVAVLPYPLLAGLAWWQLRSAESAEREAGGRA